MLSRTALNRAPLPAVVALLGTLLPLLALAPRPAAVLRPLSYQLQQRMVGDG